MMKREFRVGIGGLAGFIVPRTKKKKHLMRLKGKSLLRLGLLMLVGGKVSCREYIDNNNKVGKGE